jgi:flagellar FliJ protein
MKRFNFRFQKLLELRNYREQEAKIELGRATGILIAIENRVKETAVKRRQAARERFTSPGDAATMLVWDNYIIRLDQEAERLTKEAAQAELEVEEKRALYLEASREFKVMGKLKEKREKEYHKEMFAAETAELDDMWRGKDRY